MKQEFEKAHNAESNKITPATPPEIVTKQAVEDLERLSRKTSPQPHLTPSGMKPNYQAEQEQLRRLERMKQKLREQAEKVRNDFNRQKEGRDR